VHDDADPGSLQRQQAAAGLDDLVGRDLYVKKEGSVAVFPD
jgi:hypothetical protein